ncbi:MAG: flagellar brake protein [Athalassotoga sp.]|uniref:flagellar brake protein n=1 Tax=Athalassotoga sp. TaxID=2022597 RepID=UPI003CFBD88D
MVYFSEEVGIDRIKPGLTMKIELDSIKEFTGGELRSTVTDVDLDTVKAEISSKVSIPVEETVKLSVMDKGVVYTFYAVPVENVENNGIQKITFRLKSSIRQMQKRRFLRTEFVAIGTFKTAEKDDVFNFMTKDISAGGLRFLTNGYADLGQIIIINMLLDENVRLKDQKAQIVRKVDMKLSDLNEYGATFLDLNPSLEDKIKRFVSENELKARGSKE